MDDILGELRQLLHDQSWEPNATVSATYGVLSWASPLNGMEHETPHPLSVPGAQEWGAPTHWRMYFAELQVLNSKIEFITRTAAAPWVAVETRRVKRPEWVAYVTQHGDLRAA